jgi:hypothetical protein
MNRTPRRVLLLSSLCLLAPACKRPYRVGDHVLVEWEDGSPQLYPGYIIERVGATRFRIHFDGYDARFDEDIGVDRIRGLVTGPVPVPPPPKHVARLVGLPRVPDAGAALVVNPYKVGDRLRVRWRGSVYSAVVLEVVAKDRVSVRYEGHESAWDEVVSLDRVVGKR